MRQIWWMSLVMLCLGITCVSAQGTGESLNRTAAGRKVIAYLEAYNSGSDSVMRGFFELNLAADALQRMNIDKRIEQYHQMRANGGNVTLARVLEVKDAAARVVVRTKDDFALVLGLQCESGGAGGISMMQIAPAEPKDEGIAAMKNEKELVAAVGNYADSLSHADAFSGVVLVARDGRPVFQKAYGLARKEMQRPNALTTRFNLGSINKAFTRIAILQLAARGRLSLSDTIGTFLPDYPNREAAEKVTVQQLLDMTSGIGDFFNERYEASSKKSLNSIRGYLPLFADKPLLFEPGSRKRYSNGGYIVLGAIIEKVTGTDYYSYVHERIFVPAGMNATASFDKDSLPPDVAFGYTRQGSAEGPSEGGRVNNYATLPQRGSSAGGGYSTAGDLLRFVEAFADTSVVPVSFGGQKGLGIAGGAPGLNSALEWDPDRGYAIIVLSNYDPPAAERLAQRIRAWVPEGTATEVHP